MSGDAVGAGELGPAAADWGATAGAVAGAGAGADAGAAAADVDADAALLSETGVRALAPAAAATEGAGNRTTGEAVIDSLAAARRLISRCCKAMKAMDAASIRHRALTMAGVSQRRRRDRDQRGSGGGKAAGAAAAGGAGAAGRPTAVDRTRSFQACRQVGSRRGRAGQPGRRFLKAEQDFLAMQAPDDVVKDGLEFGVVQGVEREGGQGPPPGVPAGVPGDWPGWRCSRQAATYSSNAALSFCIPSRIRVLTVPRGQPRSLAISDWV